MAIHSFNVVGDDLFAVTTYQTATARKRGIRHAEPPYFRHRWEPVVGMGNRLKEGALCRGSFHRAGQ